MRNREATIEKEPRARQVCQHHWVIKMKEGPISQGVCKFCGATKDFGNYLTDVLETEKENYLERAEGPKREKGKNEPLEDVFSELEGGDRNAVAAGA